MKVLVAITILFCSLTVLSQKKQNLKALNKKLSEQAGFIVACEKEIKEAQVEKFGKELPKIAGECEWGSNGCPIKIVKPIYPDSARKSGFVGLVKVEIIIDEAGKVIYAKAINGRKVFYKNAERAALLSLYYPKIFCEKPVMQKKYIVYNFLP